MATKSKTSIHRHEWINASEERTETHINLPRIDALRWEPMSQRAGWVHIRLTGAKGDLDIYSSADEYHKLLAAWQAFSAGQEGGQA